LFETSFEALPLPVSAFLGVLAGLVYLLGCARSRKTAFTLIDGLILVAIMAVVAAISMPLLDAAGDRAKATSLTENLRIFRSQIEHYKIEHRGKAPLLFEGSFPQLLRATDIDGVPGLSDKQHPLGPYFLTELPMNPYTGSSGVEEVSTFPPKACSKAGGWLYHQPSGKIAPNQEGWLDK
jgi:type II secretory pathway pseudopilin PulG